jgi:hypothetical protein
LTPGFSSVSGRKKGSLLVMKIVDFSQSFRRFAALDALSTHRWVRVLPIVAIHLAALATMYQTEYDSFREAAFLATWGFLNFFWLILLRRPGLAAGFSLAMILSLIVLSQFKYNILEMTLSFVDVMIVNADTFAFLLNIFPDLRASLAVAAVVAIIAIILIWRFDPFRLGRLPAMAGAAGCIVVLAGLESSVPMDPFESFWGRSYVSNFARSGVDAIVEYVTHGYLESDPAANDRLGPIAEVGCQSAQKPPHIIMVHDESSFDIRNAPGIKVPPGYGSHFRSLDGKQRNLIIEGAGGPSWYTEYNVLAGLSARSYGRFMFNVTSIAAGRVGRGLPRALRRCGYKTVSLYPWYGAFLSARLFQTGVGVERFIDLEEMGTTTDRNPDGFYYDQALRVVESERSEMPLFVFVYVEANHFPWTSAFRADLTPDWKSLGNEPEVDEYIRRQAMSVRAYADFRDRLHRQFPEESFLLVRFGDHQPSIAARILEPALDAAERARHISAYDPKYFTTYYVVDAINFKPVDLGFTLDTIEAPYLPLVVLESAGLPLDPSFVEQKKIAERCKGLFYSCSGGAEARRFNRLLIDAGLIKHL